MFAVMLLISGLFPGQEIHSVQLFNPRTNDETPVIGSTESLILSFDDFSNSSAKYRYTLRHLDRNWNEDGLFFTEIANGSLNGIIDDMRYSFNTVQKYTHYTLAFPNEKMQPKISGNFELIVYKDSPQKPLFTRRFSVTENAAEVGIRVSRFLDARKPEANQRIEVSAVGKNTSLGDHVTSATLSIVQNNNRNQHLSGIKPSSVAGNHFIFQQASLAFSGNNEFFYFDNKIINQAFDTVAGTGFAENQNYTYLHPVWAFPLDYQYNPDVNGAYYFRRSDLGTERDANTEADYSWVYFALNSEKIDKDIFVLGGFNNFQPSADNQMYYDENSKKYIAKIYLKQGFYNYILATKNPDGSMNFGEINGNFWQTENLYQAYLYYTPFGKNYDGLLGYGEYRTPVR